MILIRQLFSAFATQNNASEQENQCKIMRFEFRFLETIIPQFHCSIIPIGAKPLSSSKIGIIPVG